MKHLAPFGSWFLLSLLLASCVSNEPPSLVDKFADHQRFISHLPDTFVAVEMAQPDETPIRKWIAELPPDKRAVLLTLTKEERAALRTAVKAPRFTLDMLRGDMSGRVDFLLMIDKRGNVVDLCVLDRTLAEEEPIIRAIDACRFWKFTPMQLAGQPAVAVVCQGISFNVR